MAYLSPLRYPGGKGRLGAWLADLMRHNEISGGCYVEPYAGGAGAALHLLLMGYVSNIVINDIDPAIYAFWWAVLNDTDRMLTKLRSTPVTLEERERQLDIYSRPSEHSLTDLGFATLFLNRTSRSGILSGGVIGGKAQNGRWLLDARFNKEALEKRIRLIARHRSFISLHSKDALEFLREIRDDLPRRTLIYLDPPYYHKGGHLYRNAYEPADHAAVAKTVREMVVPWLTTYDDAAEIEKLYAWAAGGRFEIYYSASDQARRKATELIYYGGVKLPCLPYSRR